MKAIVTSTGTAARGARAAIVAALAAVCLLAVASTAGADTFNNSLSYNYPLLAGCNVTVGPVFDNGHTVANYRTIGGATVNCNTGHHTIGATVREYWSPGGTAPVRELGNGIGTVFSNSAGFSGKILELNVGCIGRGFWVQTRVYVTIDGYGSGWLPSPWAWKADGC
jgi:hypothetical protein